MRLLSLDFSLRFIIVHARWSHSISRSWTDYISSQAYVMVFNWEATPWQAFLRLTLCHTPLDSAITTSMYSRLTRGINQSSWRLTIHTKAGRQRTSRNKWLESGRTSGGRFCKRGSLLGYPMNTLGMNKPLSDKGASESWQIHTLRTTYPTGDAALSVSIHYTPNDTRCLLGRLKCCSMFGL